MTPTDLMMRINAGRAMMNFVLSSGRYELFPGVNLNLNFPSVVGTVEVGGKQIEYGYSSGIYTKYVSALTPIKSVPAQEEIDALGGGKSPRDWDARFELAYEKCKDQNVTLVGGVAPTAMLFGQYLRRVHGKYPKDLWKTQIMTLGSVPGINTRYAPRSPRSTARWSSARSTAPPRACSASRGTSARPGCPTMTCSSSRWK